VSGPSKSNWNPLALAGIVGCAILVAVLASRDEHMKPAADVPQDRTHEIAVVLTPTSAPPSSSPSDAGRQPQLPSPTGPYAILEGVVRTSDGAPVPGAHVRIGPFHAAEAGASGTFWMQLDPGNYELVAARDKPPSWGAPPPTDVRLAAGQHLHQDLPLADEWLGSIHARLVQSDGGALTDVEAHVDQIDDDRWDGFSDPKGELVLERVASGLHRLILKKDGYTSAELNVEVPRGGRVDVGVVSLTAK